MEIYKVLHQQKVKNKIIDEAIKRILEMEIEIIIPESYAFIQAYDLVKKYGIDMGDAFHLAIAISNDAILVTRDEKFLKKTITNSYIVITTQIINEVSYNLKRKGDFTE